MPRQRYWTVGGTGGARGVLPRWVAGYIGRWSKPSGFATPLVPAASTPELLAGPVAFCNCGSRAGSSAVGRLLQQMASNIARTAGSADNQPCYRSGLCNWSVWGWQRSASGRVLQGALCSTWHHRAPQCTCDGLYCQAQRRGLGLALTSSLARDPGGLPERSRDRRREAQGVGVPPRAERGAA